MEKRIRLSIPLEPVPKGRPRVAFTNGKVRTYTPEHTLQAEYDLRLFLMKHQDKMFEAHIPVKMSVTFYRTKPKWCPKGMKKSEWKVSTLPSRKSDLDNFLKLLLDGMNGILVADDAQITTLTARKRWSDSGRIEIDLQEDKN